MSAESDNAILAERYRWFCTVGWKLPVLNHPSVIRQTARPEDIDRLIREGMIEWLNTKRAQSNKS